MEVGYWRLRDRYYRLMGCVCKECSTEFFPPVYKCRKCGSEKVHDREMPKTGEIMTYTVLRESMHGFEDSAPLILAIVKLANGVKILAQLVDTQADHIRIGDKVKAVFRRVRADGESGQIFYGYKFLKA